ncbi:MAG: TRAP transporter permease [Deltaproteobacteria bacterium]|nr:TRAP transporter permease [Deltaproteobacteria bacterium]
MNSSDRDDTAGETVDLEALAELGEGEGKTRSPGGPVGGFLWVLALCWSLFQLYIAYDPINSIIARSIHLTFAVLLVYLAFPAIRRTATLERFNALMQQLFPGRHKRDPVKIPWYDFIIAALAGCGTAYLAWDYVGIIERSGLPLTRDVWIGAAFVLLLLESARRSLGLALPALGTVFLLYCFIGPYLPRFLAHPGIPFEFIVDHMYLSDSGIWGVPLGVSTDFVFLFVLFGALLDRAGAAEYFVQVAYAMVGRFRGGPAKAAVLASGLTGMVSGSSIANVATTGTFTIPLMKRVGLPAYKAGAVEVGASTNGQLLPPVMGAAAFIMAEFLGLPYIDIVTAAAIPAVLSYIALLYVVHLEALKLNLTAIPVEELPPFWTTFLKGVHFLVPILALIYTLVILRFSAISAAFNAILLTLAIMVIQRLVQSCAAVLRPSPDNPAPGSLGQAILQGLAQSVREILQGCVSGARNMAPIAVATAAAGIIVGTVTLTGLSSRFIEAIEIISLGNVVLMLLLTALTSLILGMGLPTTANYIVMATLTAPVIVTLGGQAGLVIPVLAAHLFVFYFGILADDTPPVGLAAFAASAIAGSDPIRTGIQGFTYDLRTAILPFVFIFNLELLLISGVTADGTIIWLDDLFSVLWVIVNGLVAMMAFAAAMQGFFADRCGWPERALLIVICVAAFRPDLVSGDTDTLRMTVQFGAWVVFAGLYLLQRRRRGSRVAAA